MLDTIKEYLQAFFNSRLLPVVVVFVLLFSILINRMFELQIVESTQIIENGASNTTKERDIKATRGNIYDCNGQLLAYNKLSYNVIFSDTVKAAEMDNQQKNAMFARLIQLIEKNGNELSVEFYLEYDKNGKLQYNVEGSSRDRFLADVFSVKGGVKALTQEQKDTNAQEVYEYLADEKTGFGIDSSYDSVMALKIMTIRYAIFINRYTKFQEIVLAKDVDDVTMAAVKENSSELPGVDIAQDTTRYYKKSKYFAHILGYTGSISAEKLEQLKEEDAATEYTTDDQIGISGIESAYEEVLRGTKGRQTLTIDGGTSRIISIQTDKEPAAGNDLYLTIDAKLQEECYHLLEEHLAGILISKLNNSIYAGTRGHSTKDIRVPIYDVYNALLQNNIVNVNRFTDDDASALEKATYKKFCRKQKTILKKIKRLLDAESRVTAKSLSDDMEDFLDYFYTILKDNGIVLTEAIDTEDTTYRSYANDSISLSKYLQYAISQQWVDLDVLGIGNDFYSTQEIYEKLIDKGINLLKNDNKFTKMIYSYLIYHYELSGRDCCLLLFDQGDIKYNEAEYNQLAQGILSPYSFIIRKIKMLEITPGQLGLDPCSGSIVVTDVNTGDVKAMVTYPSYDNNKMANKVDSEYFYTYLTDSTASPLLNRPTQQEIAPGSTFKVISAIAGLEEGVISPGTTIYDRVVFDKVYGNPKCWSSSSHGNLNVSTAIENSCNYFFYTVGYMLGGGNGQNVNNNRGLERIKKYADMFGLTDKSGVEITESEPHFSDRDVVRSAIGQGTHAYAPVQMARYMTTVANNGTCYDLTLIDKIKNVNGKTVQDNKAKVRNQVKLASSTWDSIHRGLYLVANRHLTIFSGMDKTVAGKTGTAQQNTLHPNHSWFVSYAPYENPKVSVTCAIPNGYTSEYAAETVKDVYKYYFGNKKKVSGGHATSTGHYAVTD